MTTTPPTRPADHRYDSLRAGFNRAVEHRPAAVVDAVTTADLVAAVRAATAQGLAVAVMNTGHGPSVGADDAILVRTGRLRGVSVDPVRRTAIVQAGASWGDVITAAAPYGLAPLNGSSPHVGAVGYTLGGGIGPLGRRFGFAADHVHWFDVVTADGRLRHVDAHGGDRELFWAMRGAGANFGVVAAMEVGLFPVAGLYGGELGYGADVGEEALHLYASWARDVPETMSSSVMLLRYPDDDAVPGPLRGRHLTHVRIADSGNDHRAARRLVAPLRRLGPVVDSVRSMPYLDVGSIHHEPTDRPLVAFDRNELLHTFDDDAADVIAKFAGPTSGAPYMVELRAWGGALARPPSIPNAVGTRRAAFSLLAISDASAGARAARDELLAAMQPWGTGMTYLNFSGVEQTSPADVARNYLPEDFARLQAVKAAYDPRNVFRVNFNITSTTHNDNRSPR